MQKKEWIKKTALFLSGQTISLFGSSLVQFAIMWYVARTTKSGVMVTAMTFSIFVPQIIISLFAGVWADRYKRKYLIMAADGMIAIATLVLAIFMHQGHNEMWMILLISAIRSIGSGIQSPAVSALIPQLVPEDKLMKVNGINGSIQSLVNLVSPAVGGAILLMGKLEYVLLIDVITATIAIIIMLLLKVEPHAKALLNEKPDYLEDLREGIIYAKNHYFVKTLFIYYAVFSVLLVPAAFLNVLLVTRVFGDSYIYLTVNEMSFFIGAMVGGILISAFGGFKNRLHTLCLGSVIFGLLTFAVGLTNILWIYLVIMFFTGLTMPCFNAPIMVLLQEKVESDMMGRIFSLNGMIFSVTMLMSISVFGYLADILNIQYLMIFSGLMMVIFSVVMFMHRKFMDEGK